MSQLYRVSRRGLFGYSSNPVKPIAYGRGDKMILCPGLYRAGTASLSLALEHLGVGPVWHLVTNSSEQREKIDWFLEEERAVRLALGDVQVNMADFVMYTGCPVLMHFPFVSIWKETLKRYPRASVIVCMREFEEWYESMRAVMTMVYSQEFLIATNGTYMQDIPYMLDRWTDRDMWRFGERKKECKKTHYTDFLKDIQEFVPPERLLMYDVRDGWEPLCDFLGIPLPDPYVDFPHVNTRDMLETAFENAKKEEIKLVHE